MLALAVMVAAGCSDSDHEKAANKTPRPQGPLNAAALRKRVIGHTVKGRFGADRHYMEFFASDGSIRGPGYSARWHIAGDRLCLDYDDISAADCYRVRIHGRTLRFVKDGEVRGEARLFKGNAENL